MNTLHQNAVENSYLRNTICEMENKMAHEIRTSQIRSNYNTNNNDKNKADFCKKRTQIRKCKSQNNFLNTNIKIT